MKQILILPCLLLAFDAAAACPDNPPHEAPAVPDGRIASESVMLESLTVVREYVQGIEDYLSCWDPVLTDFHHNRLVHRAEEAAAAFNTELYRYREREKLASSS